PPPPPSTLSPYTTLFRSDHGLDDHQAHGVAAEIGSGAGEHGLHHDTSVAVRDTTAPAPTPRLRCTRLPGDRWGTHTTESGMAVGAAGSSKVPVSVLRRRVPPVAIPARSAVAGESRATGLRAVPAR